MSQAQIWEREGTLEAIDRLLSEAAEGRGSSLFIIGEAGLGKTTMLEHAANVGRERFQVSLGRGGVAESTLPYGVADQVLRGLGFTGPVRPEPARRSTLRARAARQYAAALEFLEGRSSATLLLLDDLHWADEDSLALLSFLCRRLGTVPVALIGTLRPWPKDALDMVSPLVKDGDVVTQRLLPLSQTSSAEMLNQRTGRRLSDASARRAAALAAGNPFLIEQIATTISHGRGLPQPDADLVATEARLLGGWFAGASRAQVRYAQAASVLGIRFRPAIAMAMVDLAPQDADPVLEALARGGLFKPDSPGWLQFAHPLVRQVVYEEIPPPVRERWHSSAFRLLAAAGADPSESAEHAARAGLLGDMQAVAILAQAGRDAMRVGAIARARQRLLAAVDVAGGRASADLLMDLGGVLLESGDGKRAVLTFQRLLGMPNPNDQERNAAQRMLGRALFIRGAAAEASNAFQVAVACALPDHKPDAVRALLDQAFISWPSGGPAQATPLLEHARQLVADGPPALRSRVDTGWAFSRFVGGDPAGIDVIRNAVDDALANPEADTTDFAWSWGILGTYGNMAKWTERFEEATRAYHVGMAAAERMGLPVAIAAVAVMHADTCLRIGNLRMALQLADRATLLAELAPERAVWAAIIHAYVAAERGDFDQCLEWFRRSSVLADPDQNWAGRVWLLHLEAVLAMHRRQTAEACSLFDQLRALANRLQILEPCIVPWSGDAITAYLYGGRIEDVRTILGSLELATDHLPCRFPRIVMLGGRAALTQIDGDVDATRRLLEEAVDLATTSGMPLLEARLRHRLGSLLRRAGQTVAARPYLRRALELAEASDADGLAGKARDELGLAGGRQRRHYVDPDALTVAELRIRRLAEQGVRSRQIATQLFLSPNTIETHLRHIYGKLRINSQLELMALARAPLPTGARTEAGRSPEK